MKLRIAAVVIGIFGLLGGGAAPAAASIDGPCLPPVIYPYCG